MNSVLKCKSDTNNSIEINGENEKINIMFEGNDVSIEVASKNINITKDLVLFFKDKGYNVKETTIDMNLPGKSILDYEK